MIKPFTFVCMLLAGGAGLYLYQSKHRAQMLDREIAQTLKQTDLARDRIGVLRAEWALLNEPDRLSELARSHTGLRTLAPTQFVALADLAAKLPPPVAPGTTAPIPADTELDDVPAPVAQATPPAPAPIRTAVARAPVEPKPEPRPVAAHPAPRPAAAQFAAQIVPAQINPTQVASAAVPPPARPRPILAPILPVSASNAAVAPGTIGESVLRAMRGNAAAYSPPMQQVAAAPSYTPPIAASHMTPGVAPAYAAPAYAYAPGAASSLLGGSRSAMPPPVPYAAR
ncbi:MAG: hypothetical protein NVSMB18_34490 [Acetobacteraceae bacterium]